MKPRAAPPSDNAAAAADDGGGGEVNCDWLKHPIVLAHCRSQVGRSDVASWLPFDTMVFCSTHSLNDMNFINVDHK